MPPLLPHQFLKSTVMARLVVQWQHFAAEAALIHHSGLNPLPATVSASLSTETISAENVIPASGDCGAVV